MLALAVALKEMAELTLELSRFPSIEVGNITNSFSQHSHLSMIWASDVDRVYVMVVCRGDGYWRFSAIGWDGEEIKTQVKCGRPIPDEIIELLSEIDRDDLMNGV